MKEPLRLKAHNAGETSYYKQSTWNLKKGEVVEDQ